MYRLENQLSGPRLVELEISYSEYLNVPLTINEIESYRLGLENMIKRSSFHDTGS